MKETMNVIFGLLGGLAVFLFGMNMMSDCLQKAAGEKMKKILALLTRNPILGVLAGALTTAVLQSSSATTVMAIGFVSAGLMSLPQAISIILGANIGTTMTAQLIAFKLSDYIEIIIFFGFIIYFLAKSERVKNIGQTIFAFGLLFLGIETMGSVMKPLASSTVFTNMIEQVAHIPILGVAVGTLMTLVVQSSSATIAVLQNFASQAGPDGVTSMLGLTGAIPILLGDNIGTTITALLASIGQSRDAKRTAVAHCIFNISGCLLFIWLIRPFAAFVQWISPKGAEIDVISRQIANAHTTFNITMTVIWIPLIWLMVKIVMHIIPDGKNAQIDPAAPVYLDDKLVRQPVAAMHLVMKEVLHCSEVVSQALKDLSWMLDKEDKSLLNDVYEKAAIARGLNEKITEYLADMFSTGVMTEDQAAQTAAVMYVMADVDRMASLCKSVGGSIQDRYDKKFKYSKDAWKDLEKSLHMIEHMYDQVRQIITSGEKTQIKDIMMQKEKVLSLSLDMRKRHMNRVGKGKCDAKLTVPYNAMLHSLERMSDCCADIADAAIDKMDFNYFMEMEEEKLSAATAK